MKLSISSFKGISPKIEARYLPDGAAQIAINVVAEGQSVRPLRDVAPVTNPAPFNAIASGASTLYRGWLDYSGDDKYWLSNQNVWDVCRSQIAGDVCEWTFMATPLQPLLATNSGLAVYDAGSATPSTGVLPRRSIPLGIPAPTEPLTGWVNYVVPTTTQAVLTVNESDLAQFVTWSPYSVNPDGFYVSNNKGTDWFYPQNVASLGTGANFVITANDLSKMDPSFSLQVSIDGGAHTEMVHAASAAPSDIAYALNIANVGGRPLVTATAGSDSVTVFSNVKGKPAVLVVKWIELPIHNGATITRSSLGIALSPYEVMTALSGTLLHAGNPAHHAFGDRYFTGALLTVGGVETGFTLTSKDVCVVTGTADPSILTEGACTLASGLWLAGEKATLSVKWGDGYAESKAATGATEDKGSYESRVYVYTWTYSAERDHDGLCDWVWESAPSPASEVANVYADSTVQVERRAAGVCSIPSIIGHNNCVANGGTWIDGAILQPPTGYKVNGIRLYRSVAGQYLFVTEGKVVPGQTTEETTVNDVEYLDAKLADALGEPCPSLTWSPPPARTVDGVMQYLNGIINLPNGMIAGFLGRDVYFCEPYRPFAWPEQYIQTLDDPIVGLGRMDTTLAVLTRGNPYFIQGSHPENMNVVKADLDQSCVSKRSIVSMGRNVFYASPDGLMMLTPGGSAVITEALFDRAYWQALQPENIHAYGHDGKYVAFFGTAKIPLTTRGGVTYEVGGFVLDTASKQFYLHGLTARAGYHDMRNDTLFLVSINGGLVRWGQGPPVANAVWRSKVFAMPQGTGFSCGQIEAAPLTVARDGADRAAYPLTVRIYADGTLFHTQTIANAAHYDTISKLLMSQRAPFRLPPLFSNNINFLGRDWEIELDVASEIFNVALAQSMSEIASV